MNMEKFDYITNYLTGKKTAKMSIRRPIDRDGVRGINGDEFAREVEFLAAQGVEEVVIDINSIGGSIKEGFSIFSAIKDAPFKTVTRVVGIAASMAGIISQAGDYRIIMDYGIFHAHGPQVPEGKTVEEGLLNKMLGSLKTMISAKADLSEAEVSEILGKETVLTAVEAQKMGFFDEIERTKGIKPELMVSNDVEALFEMANSYINKNQKMDKLNEFLQLENATEEQIISKVSEIKEEAAKVEELNNNLEVKSTEIEALTNELKEVKESGEAKVEELKNTITELKTKAATELVENSIKLGVISEESKENWITQAVNNLEETKTLLSSFNGETKAADLKNVIKPEESKGVKADRKEWDYQKWSQEDAKGLEQLKADAPEEFEALLNKYLEN